MEQLLAQIERLLEQTHRQAEKIQQLRDEIAVLKGQKTKPKFKPSGMEQGTKTGDEPDTDAEDGDGDGGANSDGQASSDTQASGDDEEGSDKRPPPKRPGSSKRNKTEQLPIHETLAVAPSVAVPEDSRFKGYRDFVVQDLRIQAHNTCYRLEVWQTPEGEYLLGELPASLNGKHFGAELRRYMLYQYHHCHVTQPLLHEQPREWGIDISVGQVDALLSGGNEDFFAEKDQLLTTGLEVSRYIIPARAIKATTAMSPRSAMTGSRGLPAPAARVALTSSSDRQ
ncbi:hypothetical protein [Thiorhodovibrio winogradskyi]|uniref:hypothetical protein n=1 Tax=Thiorhodovibrio winogradskyi TaxID=77007 RepID=UPI002E2CC03B|nr:hypothetical protein [Thiorhodovibrio winogradskyi]